VSTLASHLLHASSTTDHTQLVTALIPDGICFSCYSPVAPALAAVPRLRPLQMLLPDSRPLSCSRTPHRHSEE